MHFLFAPKPLLLTSKRHSRHLLKINVNLTRERMQVELNLTSIKFSLELLHERMLYGLAFSRAYRKYNV